MNTSSTIRSVGERQGGLRVFNQEESARTHQQLNLRAGTAHRMVGTTAMGVTPGKQVECQLFQRGRCHYGEQCKYLHVVKTGSGRGAEAVKGFTRVTETSGGSRNATLSYSNLSASDSAKGERTNVDAGSSYPVRSGAADCQYYLKTGKCNYGSRCKFNHPFRDENLVNALNRRDCFDFVQKGTCPYGKSCKYNHPISTESTSTAAESQNNSSSGSPSSSPRPSSCSVPRRSTSEPRYSTTRDLTEDFAIAQDKLALQVRGRLLHPLSSWDPSAVSTARFADKGVSERNGKHNLGGTVDVRVQHGAVPAPIANAWCRASGDEMMARSVQPHRVQETGVGGLTSFPTIPTFLKGSFSPQGPGHAQSESSMVPSNRTPSQYPHGDRRSNTYENSPGWFPLGNPSPTPLEAISSVTASGTIRGGLEAPEMQEGDGLGTSIWGSNFPVDALRGSRIGVPPLFDYQAKSYHPLGPAVTDATASNLTMNGETLKLPNSIWKSEGGLSGFRPTVSTTLPAPTQGASPVRGNITEDYTHGPGIASHRSAWRNGVELDVIGQAYDEIQIHRQRQFHAKQQKLNQAEARYHGHLQSEAYKNGFSQGLVSGTALERHAVQQRKHEERNLQLDLMRPVGNMVGACEQGMEKTQALSWIESDFEKEQTTSLVETLEAGFMDSHDFADMWRPAEKSSTFGPGLFGMQHRLF